MLAVTVNVSAASPFGDTARRVAGMTRWARSAVDLERPSLVFVQECHDDFVAVWREAGYQVFPTSADDHPQYRVRSAILAAPELDVQPVTLADLPGLGYHGSYVAAVHWQASIGSVLLLSVHASPRRAEEYVEKGWPAAVEQSGGRQGQVWDSDALLASLKHMAATGPLLAVGDLNEALGWDARHGGTWGEDYFKAVEGAGLVSVLHKLWPGGEKPTHRRNGELGLQLDHVLGTPDVSAWVDEARLDPGWLAPDAKHDDWSDHAPVWFEINKAL